MKKLVIDSSKCNACGACTLECALLNEKTDGTVEIVEPGIIQENLLSKIEDIVKHCPMQALEIKNSDIRIDIHQLKEDMNKPVEVNVPNCDSYTFSLEDKEEYLKELPDIYCDGEDEYKYKSYDSAESAGKSAFRNEVYSQAEAFIEKILVSYAQRKINSVARYAEIDKNIKYEAHKNLIKRLHSYVNQIEIYTGKKFKLSDDFYAFYTKDSDYIERMQDKPNSFAIDSVKDSLESASYFYDLIKVDSIRTYVEEKKFFGGTDYKEAKRYAYSLTSANNSFKKEVARKTWKNGRYIKQDATREIDSFKRELQDEWNEKIKLLLRYV